VEGLGYYARARNLHRAARSVPRSWGAFAPIARAAARLPGVGATRRRRWPASLWQDAAALDANVRRVVCRLYAIDQDPGRPATQRRLEALALALMPPGAPATPTRR